MNKLRQLWEVSAAFRVLVAGGFVLLFTLSLRELNSAPNSAPDFAAGIAGDEVVVEISPGDSGSVIANKLESAGVVKSALAFFRVAVADERSQRIAPGEHLLETQIPAITALEQLLDPARIPNLIKVRDGARWSEVKSSLIEFGLSEQELNAAATSINLPAPFNGSNIEGFLYPAQYSFNKGLSAEAALKAMVEKFSWMTREINWSTVGDFSPYEYMIIASLVESEGTPDVFGKVAQVIYNRLRIGMPLQFDSTIHYALKRRGEIRISIAETKVASKYNTFTNKGLPPTPIGSPTIGAIQATLQPTQGNWLYFVTVKPKETRFTDSYDQFLEWKAEYKKNFRAGLFE